MTPTPPTDGPSGKGEELSDELLHLIAAGERTLNPGAAMRIAAELVVRRDLCRDPRLLSFAERSLVREVCHDLINRAMREEQDEIPCSTAAADLRAKEAAIRKLLGATP